MRKTSTILLLAVMICVSACMCSGTPAKTEEPTVVDVEIEDQTAIALTAETVVSTESVPGVIYYTENEVVMVAKLLYRECRGVPSDTEKACVVWTVCNRVDSDDFKGDTITDIITAQNQFSYHQNTPVTDELYELAKDVLSRWNAERNGEVSVGRVLPTDYTYFAGDGVHNYFRNAYKGSYSVWNYSLPSPYES